MNSSFDLLVLPSQVPFLFPTRLQAYHMFLSAQTKQNSRSHATCKKAQVQLRL
jgi:hypothetical protein